MGWERVRGRVRAARSPWRTGDPAAAIAVHAAQLPAAGLVWWIGAVTSDQYDSGGGGAFGMVCLLVFAPLLLPLLGVLVSVVLTLPAVVLARLAGRRFGGPDPAWRLAGAVTTAVCWGGVTTALWHWPFGTTAAVLTALGVLPALGISCVRTRSWSAGGLWWRSALAGAGLFALVLGGGILATVTGLIEEYEPPELTTAQLTGAWLGEQGAELRLRPDGRAEARALPTEPTDRDWADRDHEDYVVCAGSGTWEPDADPDGTGRDGILLRLDGGCGTDTHWSVSGTAADPELFVRFGDPDGGSLRTLDRVED